MKPINFKAKKEEKLGILHQNVDENMYEFPEKDPAKWYYAWDRDSKPEYNFREGWKLFQDDWRFVEYARISYATLARGVSIASSAAKDMEAAQELKAIMDEMLTRNMVAIAGKYVPKHLLGFMFYFGERDSEVGIPEVDRLFCCSNYDSENGLKFTKYMSSSPTHLINNPNGKYARIPSYARPFLKPEFKI